MNFKSRSLLFIRRYFSDKNYIRICYFIVFKKFINFKKPKTINEKINWLKLYYKNAELPVFADKYSVRDFVKRQIGSEYLNELYGVYNSVDEINWEELPNQFVLKATHGSGWVIICKDKSSFDIVKAKEEMKEWLNQNNYDLWGEKVYKFIKPRIICERFLKQHPDEDLIDYKVYCFNGEPRFLHIDGERFSDSHYRNFYDLQWQKIPVRNIYPNRDLPDPRPENFNKMIEIARKLSCCIPFVRVNLYNINGKIIFGELTFYPQNGLSRFYPVSYERKFGELIDLNDIQLPTKYFLKNPSFIFLHRLRVQFSRFPLFEKTLIYLKKKRGDFQDKAHIDYVNKADLVKLPDNKQHLLPRVGLVKDLDNYGELIQKRAHWPKYERFLKNNNIDYDFIDIHRSNWMRETKNFDLIIFRPDICPSRLHEAKSKIEFMERFLKIKCFPASHEIWAYEDKVRSNYLYTHFNIPHINTFISHSKEEALEYINNCAFPIVSKIASGSVSRGVKLIKKIFAEGDKTYWTEYKQKNYVYFQEFIRNAHFDLRIIVVGNKIMGYYRMSTGNDFRASGSGLWQGHVSELPFAAMEIAVRLKKALKCTVLAVDMLKPNDSDRFLVIESSVFFDVDQYDELMVNNVAGYYEWNKINNELFFEFKPARYWIQELIARELIKQYQSGLKAN